MTCNPLQRYEIRLAGHVKPEWLNVSFALETCQELDAENGEAATLLVVALPDEAALHGLLNLIRDRNLKLISVQRLTLSNSEILRL
jgi:hypothetical protein